MLFSLIQSHLDAEVVALPEHLLRKPDRWFQAKRSTTTRMAPTWVRPDEQPKNKENLWSDQCLKQPRSSQMLLTSP